MFIITESSLLWTITLYIVILPGWISSERNDGGDQVIERLLSIKITKASTDEIPKKVYFNIIANKL